jgi:hypothetical protein
MYLSCANPSFVRTLLKLELLLVFNTVKKYALKEEKIIAEVKCGSTTNSVTS